MDAFVQEVRIDTDVNGVTSVIAKICVRYNVAAEVLAGADRRDDVIAFSDAMSIAGTMEDYGRIVVRKFQQIVDSRDDN